MAAFGETRSPTSRKYVAEQGIMMPNLLQTLQSFWSHSSVFVLEKYPKNLNFQSFLPLEEGLMATSIEKHAPASRKCVAEQDVIMPNLLKSLKFFWSNSFFLTYM